MSVDLLGKLKAGGGGGVGGGGGNPFDVPGGENTGNPFASNSLVVATPSRRKSQKSTKRF